MGEIEDTEARKKELLKMEKDIQKEQQKLMALAMERESNLEIRERSLMEREKALLEKEKKLDEYKEKLLAMTQKVKDESGKGRKA